MESKVDTPAALCRPGLADFPFRFHSVAASLGTHGEVYADRFRAELIRFSEIHLLAAQGPRAWRQSQVSLERAQRQQPRPEAHLGDSLLSPSWCTALPQGGLERSVDRWLAPKQHPFCSLLLWCPRGGWGGVGWGCSGARDGAQRPPAQAVALSRVAARSRRGSWNLGDGAGQEAAGGFGTGPPRVLH